MRGSVIFAAVLAASAAALNLDATFDHEAIIAAVNGGNAGWTAGVNPRFANATLAQIKRMMGTRLAKKDAVASKLRAQLPVSDVKQLPVTALPTTFTVMDNWPACANVTGFIRDQSDCGSCWAVSSTSTFNDRMCIVHNFTKELSAQDTTSCCTGMSAGCDGGYPIEAWQYFASTGVVTGGENPSVGSGSSCFPYALAMCDHHEGGPYPSCTTMCGGSDCNTPSCPNSACSESKYPVAWNKDKTFGKTAYQVSSSETAIMNEIFQRGSVTAAFEVYEDFITYKSGVYKHTTGSDLGGHAVRIVGWGVENNQKYWLVANSWNVYWGAQGFFKILRGADECGIEDEIVAGTV